MRNLINIVNETASGSLPTTLYHGTSSALLDAIDEEGIDAPSHWGSLYVAQRFAAQKVRDIGEGDPVVIAIPLSEFSTWHLEVDDNMIDFPIFSDAEGRMRAFLASGGNWQTSLRIYEAVKYEAPIYLGETPHEIIDVTSVPEAI